MADNKGKAFEAKFKEDFSKLPDVTIDRLYDPVGGYKGVKNISDFIAYLYPFIFYLECKSCRGNTFNFNGLSQYDKLILKKDIKGVTAGIVIWFIDYGEELWVPIEEVERLMKAGYKSINYKNMKDSQEFFISKIPGIIKRIYIDADYSIIIDYAIAKMEENTWQIKII